MRKSSQKIHATYNVLLKPDYQKQMAKAFVVEQVRAFLFVGKNVYSN